MIEKQIHGTVSGMLCIPEEFRFGEKDNIQYADHNDCQDIAIFDFKIYFFALLTQGGNGDINE